MHRDPAHSRARAQAEAVIAGLSERLSNTRIGAPERETTRMGALISQAQRQDVLAQAHLIGRRPSGSMATPTPSRSTARTREAGAFLPPMLYHCATPTRRRASMTPKPSAPSPPSWGIPASTTLRIWPIAAAAASWSLSSQPTQLSQEP
jgi:hypothetical protein